MKDPVAARPAKSAPKAKWVEYAVSQGMKRSTARTSTKADLVERYTEPAAIEVPNVETAAKIELQKNALLEATLSSVVIALGKKIDDPSTSASAAAAAARELRQCLGAVRAVVKPVSPTGEEEAPSSSAAEATGTDGARVVSNRLQQLREERERAASPSAR